MVSYFVLVHDKGWSWKYLGSAKESGDGPETNYHLRDQESGLNLEVGYQHIFNRFALDLFRGVGFVNNRTRQDLGESIPDSKRSYAGSGIWIPLPVVGGKMGYAF